MPDSVKKADPSHIHPAEVEEDADELRKDQTLGNDSERKLHDQNVKLDGATAANSYTGKYLDKSGIQPG